MKVRNIFTQLINYYKKHGLSSSFYRIYHGFHQILFKSQMVLFYAELNELNDSELILPPNISIEHKSTYVDAQLPNMQTLVDFWNGYLLLNVIKERFKNDAILWVIKQDDKIAGFVWSIRGKTVRPYYLPLTPNDAVLFDGEIFAEFRGRGLYPLLMNYVFVKLKSEGVSRVFGHSKAWNAASIQGINKTYFRKLTEVRTFHVFGRHITIWS